MMNKGAVGRGLILGAGLIAAGTLWFAGEGFVGGQASVTTNAAGGMVNRPEAAPANNDESLMSGSSAVHDGGGRASLPGGAPLDQGDLYALASKLGQEDAMINRSGITVEINLSTGRPLTADEQRFLQDEISSKSSKGRSVAAVSADVAKSGPGTWALLHVDLIPSSGDVTVDAAGNSVATPHIAYLTYEKGTFPGIAMSSDELDVKACGNYTLVDAFSGDQLDTFGFCPNKG